MNGRIQSQSACAIQLGPPVGRVISTSATEPITRSVGTADCSAWPVINQRPDAQAGEHNDTDIEQADHGAQPSDVCRNGSCSNAVRKKEPCEKRQSIEFRPADLAQSAMTFFRRFESPVEVPRTFPR